MKNFLADLKNLRWQNFVMLFIAGCINAFGVTAFLAPVKLYPACVNRQGFCMVSIFIHNPYKYICVADH